MANSEFGRITYTDAIEVLKKHNKKFQFPVEWGVDIQTEHERYLTEVVFKKPVFVTAYQMCIRDRCAVRLQHDVIIQYFMERFPSIFHEGEILPMTVRWGIFSIPPANRSCGFCLSSYDAPLVWTGKVS